jgi:hypothetical protein
MDKLFTDCSLAETRRLSEMLIALRTPVKCSICEDSEFLTEDFVEEFTSRLLAQHVFLGNPLMQESFDTAFFASALVAGFPCEEAPSGQRFWDLTINGKNISLKTTKAKGLKLETLHISKLTEAAWIQDCRTASARMDHTIELFREYTEKVDSIFQFRYFKPRHLYELVEIPTTLLAQIENVPKSSYQAEGPSINIPVGQNPPDFTLKLDRSDAKITLANILKSRCVVHASWEIRP